MKKEDIEITKLAETLRSVVGCDNTKDWSAVREIWARDALRAVEPECIQNPDEIVGGLFLSVACTQTNLSATKQKHLVETWCQVLPTLHEVQWIWFHSKVPQRLFEAACRLPQLTGLYIKWSGIEDLEPISHCANLTHFNLGSSASVQSIEPVGRLTNLKWLQMDNVKAATSLEPLSCLTSLEGFGFTGAEFKNYKLDTFDPVVGMTALTWLDFGAVHTLDQSLNALANLQKLQYLGLGNFFPYEEFAWLSLHLSPSICEWLQPFAKFHATVFPCQKCKKNWKVMTSGKGHRLLCPTCDSLKLARHVLRFNDAREAAWKAENAR